MIPPQPSTELLPGIPPPPQPPATAEDAVPPAVAASLEAAVEQGGRPGVVLGYVRDGESVFLAYGRTGNPASSAIGPDKATWTACPTQPLSNPLTTP